MLQLLAELYGSLPEAGNIDKSKWKLFIDEAHLIIQDATDALLQQMEIVFKLIRLMGWVYFLSLKTRTIYRNTYWGSQG